MLKINSKKKLEIINKKDKDFKYKIIINYKKLEANKIQKIKLKLRKNSEIKFVENKIINLSTLKSEKKIKKNTLVIFTKKILKITNLVKKSNKKIFKIKKIKIKKKFISNNIVKKLIKFKNKKEILTKLVKLTKKPILKLLKLLNKIKNGSKKNF